MDRPGKEDARLREVKAVLQRLQKLSAELESGALRSALTRFRSLHPLAAVGTVFLVAATVAVFALSYSFPNLKQLVTWTRDGTSKPAGTAEKAAGKEGPPVVQAATLTHRVPGDDTATKREREPGSPPPSARQKAPGPAAADPPVQQIDLAKPTTVRPAALEAALGLMNSGGVHAARRQLLAMAADGSPDVAWALARSYDPKVLGDIAAADASPDIEEAARWYRAWFAAAVREGLVAPDSPSLERIIRSMQQ